MPFLTNRDRRVLEEVGHLGAAPLSSLLNFFPTPAAGYIRLGILARRGLINRFPAKGERWVSLSPSGAAAVGGIVLRAQSRLAERRAALAIVHHLLASCGYARGPRPPAAPRTLAYYERQGEVLAVAVTVHPLRRDRLQALIRPVIFSPASRAAKRIVVFAPGATSQRLPAVPDSWQYRILLMPLPNSTTIGIVRRRFLAHLRGRDMRVRGSQVRVSPYPASPRGGRLDETGGNQARIGSCRTSVRLRARRIHRHRLGALTGRPEDCGD